LSEADFKPFELEQSIITKKTVVAREAFNAVISRHDIRHLNEMDAEKFKYKEGETVVADIMKYFFKPKEKR
jgi:3-dehydroquinate dehydratase